MKFLADENVEWPIVVQMRQWGYDVVSAREVLKGSDDDEILNFSFEEKRILITNDTDFGAMIYHQKKESPGVILMRFAQESPMEKIKTLEHLLKFHKTKLACHFTTISEGQIRIRPIEADTG